MRYDKILIVGGIGAGKTTLAKKISKILKIKNYELDNIAYKRRDIHKKQKPKIRDDKVKSILKNKKWVVEGFYSRAWTYPLYRKADIVIILNFKTSISKNRLIRRFIKRKLSFKKNKNVNQKFRKMVDLIKYIDEYPKKYFQMQKETAKDFNKNVLILTNKNEVNKFLKKLK
jgi:adenylate kinase family enzyme|tara:strand:+ start:136 stop:651 length:516 start_codon:yes stop_codon:yes gene_type:complete